MERYELIDSAAASQTAHQYARWLELPSHAAVGGRLGSDRPPRMPVEAELWNAGSAPWLVLHLFDINGSRELGRFSRTGAGAPSQCEVMETACKSEEEWRDLTRLLLEK